LTWSHFRALIRLPDEPAIRRFMRLAQQHDWTTRQLIRAIEAEHGDGALTADLTAFADKPLRARFGQLLTYRVRADPLDPAHPLGLDLGFSQMWVPPALPGMPDLDGMKPGSTVTLHTDASGHTRAALRTDRPRLWTYVARVRKVVDGDTLDVVADLGCGHRAFPRLRLRGIDTPELYTSRGRTARSFVEDAIAQVDFVVITTWRTDSYGRYLADVKYLLGEPDPQVVLSKGVYLNRALLQEELAERYLD
jgi:micrococcal nuclease